MLISSPVFVWLFLTAWIWAGALAWCLHNLSKCSENYIGLARIASVIFGFVAVQSAFWFVGCGLTQFVSWDTSFAEIFRWLFSGSQGSIVFWVSSLIGLIAGLVYEVRDSLDMGNDNSIGIVVAGFVTLSLVVIYWVFLIFSNLVSTIVVFQ